MWPQSSRNECFVKVSSSVFFSFNVKIWHNRYKNPPNDFIQDRKKMSVGWFQFASTRGTMFKKAPLITPFHKNIKKKRKTEIGGVSLLLTGKGDRDMSPVSEGNL